MGDAKFNPKAHAFKGPRPENMVGFKVLQQGFEPNEAGEAKIKAAQEANEPPPTLNAEELDFVVYGCIGVVKTAIVGIDGQYPVVGVEPGEVKRRKLSEILAASDEAMKSPEETEACPTPETQAP